MSASLSGTKPFRLPIGPHMDTPWGTLGILLIGSGLVVGTILMLRLHAFLALILGGAVVAAITPAAALQRSAVEQNSVAPIGIDEVSDRLRIPNPRGPRFGDELLIVRLNAASRRYEEWRDADYCPTTPDDASTSAEHWVQFSGAALLPELETLRVIEPVKWRSANKAGTASVGSRLGSGFGSTAASIGILIAMASIIGKCLLDSGAADRIVRTVLHWTGEKGAPTAFVASGFLLGIPVFFDTVFYLMIPLGKAMGMRVGKNYLLYVLAIVCGGTMAHSLVPPTPGPLVIAQELGVDLLTMILVGTVVGLSASLFGLLYATLVNRRNILPLRDSPDLSLADLEQAMQKDLAQLPPLWLSLTPILLPVLLIAAVAVLDSGQGAVSVSPKVQWAVTNLGDKNVALSLAAVISLVTLARYKSGTREDLAAAVQSALAGGGVIILITSAGGAFGAVLRETGVAEIIRQLPRSSPIMICTLAFLITTAVRTAQGSATVAMITAAGIFSGIARAEDLEFHPVYLACAIGCGSKPIAWMNDSGFWVITRMSGMTEAEGLKYVTPMTGLMGLFGLLTVWLGVTMFPHL